VTFRPSEHFQNDFIYDGLKSVTNGTSVLLDSLDPKGPTATAYPAILPIFAQQQALGSRTQVPLDTNLFSDTHNSFFTDLLRQDITDKLTFRNILSYRQIDYSYAIDYDATSLPIIEFPAVLNLRTEQYTEEVQLLGKSFGDRLDWVLGGFYENSPPQDYSGNDPQIIFGTASIAQTRYGDTSKALYGQGTYDLGALVSGLKATAGFRYTWDTRFLQSRTLEAGGICPGTNLVLDTACTQTSSGRWKAPTWDFSLDYQVQPNTLIYVATRRGYRGGGFNTGEVTPSLQSFDPETVTDAEIGIKSDFSIAGRSMRIDAAIYHQAYDNIQVSQEIFDPGAGTLVPLTQNAATAKLWGAELEAWLNITERWQVGLNFDRVSLQYTSFAPGVDPAPLLGLEKYNRPPYKYGVNTRYTLPTPQDIGTISLNANWSWQALSGDTTVPFSQIPSFGLLTLGSAWDNLLGNPLDASLFVTNATNTRYLVQAQSLYNLGFGFADATYGEPRMFGVRLRYRFGKP
jgi:iron complex outermembrane receptor protein